MNEETQTPPPVHSNGLIKRIFKFLLKAVLFFLIFSVGITIFYRFLPVPYTPLMFWRSTASIFTEDKFTGIEKKWVPIEQISKSMQQSVIKSEDYKFYQHHGFDFEAIEKAMQYNKTHKKTKGASTISQQTAKNVFLWPSRSWMRKGLEAYFTVLIEALWPKERILECYLNVIELGKGVYGVEAASQKFFKKPASKLNASQAALMAAVLPNPIRFRIDKPSRYITNRQRKIMGRRAPPMIAAGAVERAEIKPVDSPEEKSKEFFSLKFDSEEDEANVEPKTKEAEAPSDNSNND
ncbi:MAG: monofunctional biosynthetic peptidoglycan transglycosylase [Rhizobacter sp.]|nr:monofunctional biosynthetic peptidoglycan transglycosylase [Bacteriovorax sp.]